MSKNLTRKGLALGAVVALGSTLFAGAPAFAAGELKLEAATGGALLAVPHATAIELKTSVATGYLSDELVGLKYKITTGGSITVYAETADGAGITSATTALVTAAEASDVIADSAYAAGDLVNHLDLLIKDDASTPAVYAHDAASKTITVLAFVDKDGDDVADSDEWQISKDVTWVDSDLINLTSVLTQPALGDTTVSAKLTSTNINMDQSKGAFQVKFTEDIATDATETDTTGTYSATDNDVTFTTAQTAKASLTTSTVPSTAGATYGAVVAGTYSAQVQWNGGTTNYGSASTRTVSSTTVATVTPSIVAGATNKAASSNDTIVRSGAGSVKVTYTVADSTPAGVKDKTVTFKLAENAINSLASTGSASAGGKTLTNTSAATAQEVTFTGVTDADGEVVVTISYTGLVKTNVLKLTATVDGKSATAQTFTAEDSAPAKLYQTNTIGEDREMIVAKDAAFAATYNLVDQFGAISTATGYTIQVTDGTQTVSGTVSNGKASVSFAGYAATGSKTLTASTWKNGVDQTIAQTTELTIASPNAASAVSITTSSSSFGTSTSGISLNTKAFAAGDVREGATASTVENGVSVTGLVTDVNGNATQAKVTLSGAGLLFTADDGESSPALLVFAKDSITVDTEADGTYKVTVYSNLSGKKTLKITSGSASKTQDIYYNAAAATSATKIEVISKSTVAAGKILAVKLKVTDAFGNPVNTTTGSDTASSVKLSVAGVDGYFASTPATETDDDGVVSAIFISDDSGVLVVTAKYDTTGTVDDLSVTSNVLVGISASVSAGSKKANVVVKNAAGATVKVVSGAKSTTKVATSNSYKLSLTKLTKGSKTVKVYVNDILVASKKVTVRR